MQNYLAKWSVNQSVKSDSVTILSMEFSRPQYWTGSLSCLQGIFPTQGLKPGPPHCRQILYQLSHKGSPRILEWVAFLFSRGSSPPRNWIEVFCIADGFFTNWATREAFFIDYNSLKILRHFSFDQIERNMKKSPFNIVAIQYKIISGFAPGMKLNQ